MKQLSSTYMYVFHTSSLLGQMLNLHNPHHTRVLDWRHMTKKIISRNSYLSPTWLDLVRRSEEYTDNLASGQCLRQNKTNIVEPPHQSEKWPTSLTEILCGTECYTPCSCWRFYSGETVRRLETRKEEHKNACKKGTTEKSAIAEHAWELGQYWTRQGEERAAGQRKPACSSHTRGSALQLRWDLELPGCWMTALNALDEKPHPQALWNWFIVLYI